MIDINPIYHNAFGVAFQWKQTSEKDTKKVQLVFRDTGLLVTHEELLQFSKNIIFTKKNSPMCTDCAHNESCRALLVDSPAPQITFAMNAKELAAIEDLVEGTLFQINLDNYLNSMCDK